MTRYVAFLRGVSPMNASMADLRRCYESLGCSEVRTVLSSGNVVFTSRATSTPRLVTTLEAGMARHLPRSFPVVLRTVAQLQELLASDPWSRWRVPAGAKRVVTFLAAPHRAKLTLPVELDGARILALRGTEAFTAYVPSPRGPVFMTLIERTFGKNVTTRTWDTVRKCAAE